MGWLLIAYSISVVVAVLATVATYFDHPEEKLSYMEMLMAVIFILCPLLNLAFIAELIKYSSLPKGK